MNFAVLASHNGTTLQALLDACHSGRLSATPRLVISNNSNSEALARARRAGVEALHFSSKTHPDPAELDEAIVRALDARGTDLVVLAGYMKKLGRGVLRRYAGRIINTHPALLPKYGGQGMYGMAVHEAVLAAKEAESGVTIHLVDEDYDTGAPIAQASVRVLAADDPQSLAARVQLREKELLVETLEALARGTLTLPERARPLEG